MSLPRVVADGPLSPALEAMLNGHVELLPWSAAEFGSDESIEGIYTYGHPLVDGQMMDRLPSLRVISNNGVGVDHIDLAAAKQRGIAVGITPGVLDGATADMAIALMLAVGRRVVESDKLARDAGTHSSSNLPRRHRSPARDSSSCSLMPACRRASSASCRAARK